MGDHGASECSTKGLHVNRLDMRYNPSMLRPQSPRSAQPRVGADRLDDSGTTVTTTTSNKNDILMMLFVGGVGFALGQLIRVR